MFPEFDVVLYFQKVINDKAGDNLGKIFNVKPTTFLSPETEVECVQANSCNAEKCFSASFGSLQ